MIGAFVKVLIQPVLGRHHVRFHLWRKPDEDENVFCDRGRDTSLSSRRHRHLSPLSLPLSPPLFSVAALLPTHRRRRRRLPFPLKQADRMGGNLQCVIFVYSCEMI